MRSTPMSDERAALVALLRTRPDGMTWPDITLRVLSRGSSVEVWDECAPLTLLPRSAGENPLVEADNDLRAWQAQGLRVTTVLDADYPKRLAGIFQAPPLLFAVGELRPDDRAVSVVGSRKASPQGKQIASAVASDLVHDGITVLSGLAAGIDTAAHTSALATGGRTVAVIGTGIRRAYPATNRSLQEEIGRRGLVLSQFWPDAPPRPEHFPMRNATMSGYGLATVVIEAGEHSGARIQARRAVEHGRPVILTEMVVDQNAWAKELVGRPRVHVAAGSADIVRLVRGVEQENHELEGLVRQFAEG